jgi:hypothetical protein
MQQTRREMGEPRALAKAGTDDRRAVADRRARVEAEAAAEGLTLQELRDLSRVIEGDEAVADPAPNILGRRLAKISG